MPPKLYGIEHIVYLIVFAVFTAAAVLVARFVTKTYKQKTILIKSVGGVLLASIIFNRIALAVWHKNAVWLLPNSYCGMSSLLLGVFVLIGSPHHKTYDFLFYMEAVGGISAVFYPYFIGQGDSVFFPPTISGLLHHSVGFILCVLLVQCKWFTPLLSRWKAFPIGISVYTLYGLFLLDVCGMPEAMQIDAPIIAGTPLKWWFILIVGSALLLVILLIIDHYGIKKTRAAAAVAKAQTLETTTAETAATTEITENE